MLLIWSVDLFLDGCEHASTLAEQVALCLIRVGSSVWIFEGYAPGGTRTPNSQIRSLVLCPLSYGCARDSILAENPD